MQKDDEGDERPIAFMSKPLCDVETRYIITKKQAKLLSNLLNILGPMLGTTRYMHMSCIPLSKMCCSNLSVLDLGENGYPKSKNMTLTFAQRKLSRAKAWLK